MTRGQITLYADSNYGGKSLECDGNIQNLKDFNDRLSSLKVQKGYWILYNDSCFNGSPVLVHEKGGPDGNGQYPSSKGYFDNDKVSSVKDVSQEFEQEPTKPTIYLFEHSNYRGNMQKIEGSDLVNVNSNDTLSSVIVKSGIFTLFEHVDGGGKQWIVGAFQGPYGNGFYPSSDGYFDNDSVTSVKLSDYEVLSFELTGELTRTEMQSPFAILSENYGNNSSVEQEKTVSLGETVESSVTFSWSNSTMVGVEVKTEASIPFFGSAEMTGKIEDTFSFGKDETNTISKSFTIEVPLKAPVGKREWVNSAAFKIHGEQGYKMHLKTKNHNCDWWEEGTMNVEAVCLKCITDVTETDYDDHHDPTPTDFWKHKDEAAEGRTVTYI